MLSFKKLIISLVVITELKGLSLNATQKKSAEIALDFVNYNCTILTSKGNEVKFGENMGSEVFDSKSADDIILECAKSYKNEGGILVTDDLNLKLKARGSNVVCVGGGELKRLIAN